MPSQMYRPQKCAYPFCINGTLQKQTAEHYSTYLTKLCTFLSCSVAAEHDKKSLQSHMNEVCSLLLMLLIQYRSKIYPPVFYRELMPTQYKTGSLWKRTKRGDVRKDKKQLETPSSVKRTTGIISLLLCFPLIQENTKQYISYEENVLYRTLLRIQNLSTLYSSDAFLF